MAKTINDPVIWFTSQTGKVRIALDTDTFKVWAVYTGTRDLAPIKRSFRTEAAARTWVASLWPNL